MDLAFRSAKSLHFWAKVCTETERFLGELAQRKLTEREM